MKKYIFLVVIVAVILLCRNGISKNQAKYYRNIYDLVNDEYTMYGEQEGSNIAVYDAHNNKIRLIQTKGMKGRKKFICFYKRENSFVFEINENSGIIFTEGNKISIDKYDKLYYIGDDEYFYKKK